MTDSLRADLSEICDTSVDDLRIIVNRTVLVTGATGFVGTWIVLSWITARKHLSGTGRLIITSRSPEQVRELVEAIDVDAPVEYLSSDIKTLCFPELVQDAFVIHAATPASASMNTSNPAGMLDVIIEGQRQVIAECIRTNSRLLFLSSGAVYGRQPLDVERLPENWEGAPDISKSESAYHEGKRVAELMAAIARDQHGLDFVTARLFAFLAPFLPFDTHFAAGNFLRDAFNGSPIRINSGGGSVRSYQYATDLVSWLLKLLIHGTSGSVYNVGSDESVTIRELAETIAGQISSNCQVEILGQDRIDNVSKYVPSIEKIKTELGITNRVDLVDAIRRTSEWATQLSQRANHEQ